MKKLIAVIIAVIILIPCSAYGAQSSAALEFYKSTKVMTAGNAVTLNLKSKPDGTVEWKSSNDKVAAVSKNGKLRAKALGVCTVTASCQGSTAKCTVYVKRTKTLKLAVGESYSLKAKTANVKNRKNGNWKSSDKTIASVDKNGRVTGIGAGECKITLTVKGRKYVIPVKVKPLISVKVTEIESDPKQSNTYIRFKNNSRRKITYVTLEIKQYDNRRSRLESPYEYYYVNETLKPDKAEEYSFVTHPDTKHAKVKILKVWFSDGSTISY